MIRDAACVLLTVVILASAGCGYVKQSYLDSFVAEEKQKMPKRLFGDLEAVDVQSAPSELIYICQSKRFSDEEVKELQQQTKVGLNKHVKRNSEKFKDLIDNKIKFTIVMNGKNDSELYRLTVNPWEL